MLTAWANESEVGTFISARVITLRNNKKIGRRGGGGGTGGHCEGGRSHKNRNDLGTSTGLSELPIDQDEGLGYL